MTPNEAEVPENFPLVRKNQEETKYSLVKRKKPVFKLNDRVRISINKDKFGRIFHHYFKTEIFRISGISQRLGIPTYQLTSLDESEPLIGQFYSGEISLVP